MELELRNKLYIVIRAEEYGYDTFECNNITVIDGKITSYQKTHGAKRRTLDLANVEILGFATTRVEARILGRKVIK